MVPEAIHSLGAKFLLPTCVLRRIEEAVLHIQHVGEMHYACPKET